ncbi:MAG: UvrD-helicase domain-containing protein, partial [Lachnospiraceae bacterium]|nr:UvrD-helicase domain-containing protein [Lachnospiraceae bacterium]
MDNLQDPLSFLNDRQKSAVLHTEGPVLIFAGAGSGKTRVITSRVAYLIREKGVKPWNIMAITFTNKAAKEMRERVDRMVGMGSDAVWVATFHSSCVRFLRRNPEAVGYERNFTIYDADDSRRLMKQVIDGMSAVPNNFKPRSVSGAVSRAKNDFMSPDDLEAEKGYDLYWRSVAEAYREYQKRLRANNAMDFDDLLLNSVKLLSENPEILENWQERFRYIMVDEYQDVNAVQFELV